MWCIFPISFTCLYKLFTIKKKDVFVWSAVYQAPDQITNKCVWVALSDVATAESLLKKHNKKTNESAWENYISHWGVDMQTRSLICHFINITASVRWPTLLFSICVVKNKGSFVFV